MEQLIIKETEVILKRAKDYYRNNRDELKVKAKDKYRELSEEEKDGKREYGRNRYHNMSEEDLDKQHNFFICIFFIYIK